MKHGKPLARIILGLFLLCPHLQAKGAAEPTTSGKHTIKDPIAPSYKGYSPEFLIYLKAMRHRYTDKERKLSSEKKYYTLNLVEESSRAYALVAAAKQREAEGLYREALEIYQKVISKHADKLYRVSEWGIFVPIGLYCQLRILRYPKEHLDFYRVKYDPKAKEAFEYARQKNYLEGIALVRDSMLATSYGAKALLVLGDAALDRGHHLEALEYYESVLENFPDKGIRTPELALKATYCRKMLGDKGKKAGPSTDQSALSPAELARLKKVVSSAQYEKQGAPAQKASAPNLASDDYVQMPPTTDPLGLREPVWKQVMPGTRRAKTVYTQPVVTTNSIIYRHKNVVYCRSILNGEIRWKNDLGGRVTWQRSRELQWPQEDVLVRDGLVITPMFKVGMTLVALDEITGKLKWAYGPMVAGNNDEANIRFGAAPAAGPQTVYAGYVQDNIEGDTHTDTQYGVIAFETATGRIKWRRSVCRLLPGKFTSGFAAQRRNRIRSFFSPPLYHQGTVYICTNAGSVAALDALSGRIKWVMRYPYYHQSHDATRSIYAPFYRPTLWYNQRPLLIGDRLYVHPVDSSLFFCLDRRTGKILWNRSKMSPLVNYFVGAMSTGELVFVLNGRTRRGYHMRHTNSPVVLLDPKTGKDTWQSPDLLAYEDKPVLKHYLYNTLAVCEINSRPFYNSARPFLSSDDMLFVGNWASISSYPSHRCFVYHLAGVDLKKRKVVHRRRYLNDYSLVMNRNQIRNAATRAKDLEALPHKHKKVLHEIKIMKEISKDTVPVNEHGPFMPFARATFERYGTPFELRVGPRSIEMVFDREKVKQTLAGRKDPAGTFARAELAMAETRLKEATELMKQCLAGISSEDLDFRATVNQLLYKVRKELARTAIRGGDRTAEKDHCVGMSRSATTLADEVETLFAVAEAAERRGEFDQAARQFQSLARTYGQYEYPVPEITTLDVAKLKKHMDHMLDTSRKYAGNPLFGPVLGQSFDVLKGTYPVYRSAVSPLAKTLNMRAGELAAAGLIRMQKASPEFAGRFEKAARAAIGDKAPAEQLARLWEFPGTPTAQAVLEELINQVDTDLKAAKPGKLDRAALRKQLWVLADAARICGLTLPKAFSSRLAAPSPRPADAPLAFPMESREKSIEEQRGTIWLVLERRGDRAVRPELLFLGGRVKKKLDSKFVLQCRDMATGELRWKATEKRADTWSDEIRLKGRGDEPGFFEAFVHGELVIVHGMYDVLAFGLNDGKLVWRYQVPFAFEIKHAVNSGDLLVLAGKAETVALYLPTRDPRGEVVWQEKEVGDLYIAPFFHGDRFVSLRKSPSNLTIRYRSTGKLIGRLTLPDLILNDTHPLLKDGPLALPAARDGKRLVVSDGWYYIMLDVEKMAVVWKRLIDSNDATRVPPMRFALNGDYLAVLKEDYDTKTIHMLSSATGRLLWRTDPKNVKSPQPIHSMVIRDGKLYGIMPHPGQAFYFVGLDCKTGKQLFRPYQKKGYAAKPQLKLRNTLVGDCAVALIKDRQNFEFMALRLKDGKPMHTLKVKAAGDFGVHGRVSATAQNGKLVLLGTQKLVTGVKR